MGFLRSEESLFTASKRNHKLLATAKGSQSGKKKSRTGWCDFYYPMNISKTNKFFSKKRCRRLDN
jgi:hypothetical protein